MLHTLLKHAPVSENAKVVLGVSFIMVLGYLPMTTRACELQGWHKLVWVHNCASMEWR